MARVGYVYMVASKRYGTLYTGVTSDLVRRVWEHRSAAVDGFTKTHGVKRLVWFETHEEIYEALAREKQIKEWKRNWKIELIQKTNPLWLDLFHDITA
jgi:putative endonuclease